MALSVDGMVGSNGLGLSTAKHGRVICLSGEAELGYLRSRWVRRI